MRCSLLVTAIVLACCGIVAAQSPAGTKYGLGRAPTQQELFPRDAHIPPSGDGLPPGSGTAKAGEVVYQTRGCGSCHGPTGVEGPGPRVVGPPTRMRAPNPHPEHGGGNNWAGRGIVNWPFAPILWSWINVAMPLHQQGYLTPDEVYSLTAYILYRNGIIKEGDVMDAKTLPTVQMPNRDGYVPPPFAEWKPGLRGR
jgi:cytochrome c